jgi:HSP20 family molecular chaperone IbpA
MSKQPMEGTQRELEAQPKQPVTRELTRSGPVFRPDVDILELPDEYRVYADLPGTDGEHVQVRLEEGVLSIDGDLALEPDPAWVPLHREYRLGGWHREFQLSDRIAADRISAQMRDGVLEIHLPKAEAHRPRRIEVQTA